MQLLATPIVHDDLATAPISVLSAIVGARMILKNLNVPASQTYAVASIVWDKEHLEISHPDVLTGYSIPNYCREEN